MVRFLLDNDVDVNARDEAGETPLIWAMDLRHKEIVAMLLQKSVDVNAVSVFGLSSLRIAAGQKDAELVKILLERGANPSMESLQAGTCSDEAIVGLMLSHGADVNYLGKDGTLPLIGAIAQEEKGIPLIREFVKKGADVNISSRFGTPLNLAVGGKKADMVRLLLDAGADMNSRNKRGDTAYKSSSGEIREIMDEYQRKGK